MIYESYSSNENPTNLQFSSKKTLTVPEPFHFETREKIKPQSIREKKLKEMIEEKQKEEEYHLNYRVKPKEIPLSVSTPKFEQILERQKERSEEIKRTSIERTKEFEKPFKFYLRDKEKVKPDPPESPKFRFKASPIPRSCTVPLFYSLQQEKENSRKERIAAFAQKTLRESSLPPRMKMYSNSDSFKKIQVDEIEVYKYKAKDPPNFEKLQAKFQKTLEAKKKAKKPTKIEPFSIEKREKELNEKRSKSREEKQKNKEESYSKELKNQTLIPGEKDDKKTRSQSKKKIRSFQEIKKSLKKNTENNEKIEKNDEENKKIQKNEKNEHNKHEKNNSKKASPVIEKQYKYELVKPRLKNIIADSIEKQKESGNDIEERLRKRRENVVLEQQEYNRKLEEIRQRVNKKPLLVEIATDSTIKNRAKIAVLLQIKKNLEESGVNTKKYFTAEEAELIKQGEAKSTH